MDDAKHLLGAFFTEDPQGRFRGRTGMDHQRFPYFFRQPDLPPEGLFLLVPGAQVVVPIQPRLTHEAHVGIPQQDLQILGHAFIPGLGLVGMHTQGGLDIRCKASQVQHRPAIFEIRAHGDEAGHSFGPSPCQRSPHLVLGQVGSGQMAMGIHEHEGIVPRAPLI